MYNAIAEVSQKTRSLQPSSIVYVNKKTSPDDRKADCLNIRYNDIQRLTWYGEKHEKCKIGHVHVYSSLSLSLSASQLQRCIPRVLDD